MRLISKGHAAAIRKQLAEADRAHWVVYMADARGWDIVRAAVTEFLARGNTEFHLIVNRDRCIDRKTANDFLHILKTLELGGDRASLRLWHKKSTGDMHAKLYTASKGGRLSSVIVGSANLTRGGFQKNIELSAEEQGLIPDAEVSAFIRKAMKNPVVTSDNIEELVCPPGPDEPEDQFHHLRVAHVRDTFKELTEVYLNPEDYDLGVGRVPRVKSGELELQGRATITLKLLNLGDREAAKRIGKMRTHLNPKHSSWLLRWDALKTSVGWVVPHESIEHVEGILAHEKVSLRSDLALITATTAKERKKKLAAWSKGLCKQLGLGRTRTKRTSDRLLEGLVERTEESWKLLKYLSIDLVTHDVPTFDDEAKRLDLHNDLVCSLVDLVRSLASHKRLGADKRNERLGKLHQMNKTVPSQRVAQLIKKLERASTQSQRNEVARQAHRYWLQRQSWFGMGLYEKRKNIENDWA